MNSGATNQTNQKFSKITWKKRQHKRMIDSPNLFRTFIRTYFTGNGSYTFLYGGSDKTALLTDYFNCSLNGDFYPITKWLYSLNTG